MGDRGNILVNQAWAKDDKPSFVYLYTHWGGSFLGSRLQEALQRHQRWDDAPYLTRIIFDTMTKNEHGEETGYGISTMPPDNEHAYLVVDCTTKCVYLVGEGVTDRFREASFMRWTFQEFCDLPQPDALL